MHTNRHLITEHDIGKFIELMCVNSIDTVETLIASEYITGHTVLVQFFSPGIVKILKNFGDYLEIIEENGKRKYKRPSFPELPEELEIKTMETYIKNEYPKLYTFYKKQRDKAKQPQKVKT